MHDSIGPRLRNTGDLDVQRLAEFGDTVVGDGPKVFRENAQNCPSDRFDIDFESREEEDYRTSKTCQLLLPSRYRHNIHHACKTHH